jgi:hypothetical protein
MKGFALPVLLLLLSGCAAAPLATPHGAAGGGATDTTIVIELSVHRSAELADTRGALRVFDQEVRVGYRRGGRGPGLDAGQVSLDGRPMRRLASGRGVNYLLGRDDPSAGTPQAHDDPWMTLANRGGPSVADTDARVKLAPFPVVTQPAPNQALLRSDEQVVVMLPPADGVWYRVSLVAAAGTVFATDLGQGRWLFASGTLASLAQGRAKVLVETEASCGDCEVAGHMRAAWSGRAELEIPVTLL